MHVVGSVSLVISDFCNFIYKFIKCIIFFPGMTAEENREVVDGNDIFKIPGRMIFHICVKGVCRFHTSQ